MIRLLSEHIANQIAAGEVIERPFSVIKELLENSIDAGADNIIVHIRYGGKGYIRVSDNGKGMSKEEIPLSLLRHATSKLDTDNLFDIRTLGFRGEALPSIAAVSRMSLCSRSAGDVDAWQIQVEGGDVGEIMPSSLPQSGGTIVEVRDLFYATPARLKFMRSDRAETGAIVNVINRLAMAYPGVSFVLYDGERQRLSYPAHTAKLDTESGDSSLLFRLRQVMGGDFSSNAMALSAEKDGITFSGYAGLPTLNRATGAFQFLFVNGRAVKDMQMLGAVRAAYADFLARGRYPMAVLYLQLPPVDVDVNVHPQKTDVRFRDYTSVRSLLVVGLRHALGEAGFRASSTIADTAMRYAEAAKEPLQGGGLGQNLGFNPSSKFGVQYRSGVSLNECQRAADFQFPSVESLASSQRQSEANYDADGVVTPSSQQSVVQDSSQDSTHMSLDEYPLGAAMAQLHDNYIVAQTTNGIVIVDQHAAHERILYEQMKAMFDAGETAGQGLLMPEVVDLSEEQASFLLRFQDDFARLGLVMEAFGAGTIMVRETPALLGVVDVVALIRDLADEISEYGTSFTLKDRLQDIFATMACHASIRSGRRLQTEEMNALLRQMESTPYAGQCNHGRPTYVELKLKDIEKLFGRR